MTQYTFWILESQVIVFVYMSFSRRITRLCKALDLCEGMPVKGAKVFVLFKGG